MPVHGLNKIWGYLAAPSYPRTALSISETELVLVSLKRQRRHFEPTHLAMVRLSAGVIRADFNELNIVDESQLAQQTEKLIAEAGVSRLRRLAVALPEGSVRSLIVSLDNVPAGRNELMQMLSWRVERSFGCKPGDVRITLKHLNVQKEQVHWLATVVRNHVIDQYETFFRQVGLQVGLVLPAHLAQAQWLLRAGVAEDQVMLSLNDRGFVAVIVRGNQPVLVREVFCADAERDDEFYRLMIFYRDRMAAKNSSANLSRLLVLGSADEQERFRRVLANVLEAPVTILEPGLLGLHLPTPANFSTFAAAAGLSTFSWGT